jgi:hypothetical protein
MKKIILMISVIALMFVAYSCNKENATNPLNNPSSRSEIASPWGLNRTLYISQVYCFCWIPAEDCYDLVTVGPGALTTQLDSLDAVITRGPTAIAGFFKISSNYDSLLPSFSGANLDSLKTGNYQLVRKDTSVSSILDRHLIALLASLSPDSANIVNHRMFTFEFKN